jgi:hypothetical protein
LKENDLEPSDIKGFTPDGHVILKPITQRANYKPDVMFRAELKKDSCCCGATKSNPCACMIQGVMECSDTCPCSVWKELREGNWGLNEIGKSKLTPEESERLQIYGAEEGQPCPTCSSCSHKFHLRDTTIHDEEVWVDVECEKCRLQAGGYADLEMDYEPATLEYNRTALNIVECPNCNQGFTLNAENWGGDPKGKLAQALAKAREKAKKVGKTLKIEKLDAETSGQWEIGEQLEEAQMNAETTATQRKWRIVKEYPHYITKEQHDEIIEALDYNDPNKEIFYVRYGDTIRILTPYAPINPILDGSFLPTFSAEDEKEKCPSCQEVKWIQEDGACDDCRYCEYCEEHHPDEVWDICNAHHYDQYAYAAPTKGIDTFTKPFEESSLDSGTVKSIVVGIGLGLLGCFGYSKWK